MCVRICRGRRILVKGKGWVLEVEFWLRLDQVTSRAYIVIWSTLKSPSLASNFVSDMIGPIYAYMVNHQVT